VAAGLTVVLVAPGWLALRPFRTELDASRLWALAVGLSLSTWPLLLLWTTAAGWRWSAPTARAFILILALLWLADAIGYARLRRAAGSRLSLATTVLSLVVILSLVARFHEARGLLVPAWVDGVHHTLMARLIVEAGGVPSGYRPYLAVDVFYYHYGFHSAVAWLHWVTGQPAHRLVLVLGQTLAGLAALSVSALVAQVTGSKAAAIGGAIITGALYWFPAYYVSWARYTQLAGIVILPAAATVILALALSSDAARWNACLAGRQANLRWHLLPGAIAVGGLFVTHYRVFFMYAVLAAVALLMAVGVPGTRLVRGWRFSRHIGQRPRPPRRPSKPEAGLELRRTVSSVVGVHSLAGLLVAPWIVRNMARPVAQRALDAATWFEMRRGYEQLDWLIRTHFNPWLLVLGLLGLVAGLLVLRRGAVLTAAWVAGLTALVNPYWLGLPASRYMNNFSLLIAAFVPVSIGIGLLLAEGEAWWRRQAADRTAGVDGLPARGRAALAYLASRQGELRLALRALLVAALGAVSLSNVMNHRTEFVAPDDLPALEWIACQTPPDAVFLVNAMLWQTGTYSGTDAGYWIQLLTGRRTLMPPAVYNYGQRDYALEVRRVAEQLSQGDALSDADISRLIDDGAVTHAFVGAKGGAFTAERLARHPRLRQVYQHGRAHVFEVVAERAETRGSGIRGAGRP
jgi:hypothetical protein